MECKCDMRTKLVGDGCESCNPELALDHAKETIEALEDTKDDMIVLLGTALLASRNRLITITNEEYKKVFDNIEGYLKDYD